MTSFKTSLSLFLLTTTLAISTLTTACSVSVKDKKSEESDPMSEFMKPDPEVTALYEPLAAPTPNKLRGVWKQTAPVSTDKDNADVRFRFTDDAIIGGARCDDLMTGGDRSTPLPKIDDSKGEIDLDFGFSFTTTSSRNGTERHCGGSLPGGVWSFEITGTTLTLTRQDSPGTYTSGEKQKMTFMKLGV